MDVRENLPSSAGNEPTPKTTPTSKTGKDAADRLSPQKIEESMKGTAPVVSEHEIVKMDPFRELPVIDLVMQHLDPGSKRAVRQVSQSAKLAVDSHMNHEQQRLFKELIRTITGSLDKKTRQEEIDSLNAFFNEYDLTQCASPQELKENLLSIRERLCGYLIKYSSSEERAHLKSKIEQFPRGLENLFQYAQAYLDFAEVVHAEGGLLGNFDKLCSLGKDLFVYNPEVVVSIWNQLKDKLEHPLPENFIASVISSNNPKDEVAALKYFPPHHTKDSALRGLYTSLEESKDFKTAIEVAKLFGEDYMKAGYLRRIADQVVTPEDCAAVKAAADTLSDSKIRAQFLQYCDAKWQGDMIESCV